MKKLLLTLALILGFISPLLADKTVTIDFSKANYTSGTILKEYTSEGIKFSFSKASGKSDPAYYSQVRLYADNSMTITALDGSKITKVVFTCLSGKDFTEGANGTGYFAASGTTYTWTPTNSSSSATIKGNTSGQVYFNEVTITTDATTGGGTVTPEPDPDPTPNEGETVWKKVTSASDLTLDGEYIVVASTTNKAMLYTGSGYLNPGEVIISDNTITLPSDSYVAVVKFEGTSLSSVKLHLYSVTGVSQNYYTATSSGKMSLGSTGTTASVNFESGSTIKITFVSNGTLYYNTQSPRFVNYTSTQTAINLYKKVGKRDFVTDFQPTILRIGADPSTITPTNSVSNPPAITYSTTDTNIVELSGNQLTGLADGTATIKAEWAEDDTWKAGHKDFTIRVLPEAKNPTLEFRHKQVKGKLGVGVVSQAVYYTGDGTVTYSSSDPSIVKVDPKTGMIRTEDILQTGSVTITATASETDYYNGGFDSYEILIEEPDAIPTAPSDATFDYTYNKYGMTVFNPSNTSQGLLQSKYEMDMDPNVMSYIENGVTLEFIGQSRTRYFHPTTGADHLRIYKNAEFTFTAPDGATISSVTLEGSKTSAWTVTDQKNAVDGNKWSASEGGVQSVSFKATDGLEILMIIVNLDSPDVASGKILPELAFKGSIEGKERIINTFVGKTEDLPTLTFTPNPDFKWEFINFDIDEIDESEELEGEQVVNYAIESDFAEQLKATVYTPGVYTFRASVDNSDEQKTYGGMAILRLNVFPHFDVLPTSDDALADNAHNAAPQITIVNTDDNHEAEIKLPNVADMLDKYGHNFSTLEVTALKVNDEDLNPTDEAALKHTFTDDGKITYTLRYAGTDDFSNETTAFVVLMPKTTEAVADNADGTKKYTVNAHHGDLQYRYVLWNPSKDAVAGLYSGQGSRRVAPLAEVSDDMGWAQVSSSTDEVSTLADIPSDIPSGTQLAIQYRSSKDISEAVTGVYTDDLNSIPEMELGSLFSEPRTILLSAEAVTVTVGNLNDGLDGIMWIPSMQSSGYDFTNVLSSQSGSVDASNLTVTVTPKFTTAIQPSDGWSESVGIPNWLWNQMVAIENTGTGTDGNVVDGYYIEPTLTPVSSSFTPADDSSADEYVASITKVQFPCSGLYTIKVESTDDTYEVVNGEQVVNVYPNLLLKYSYELNGQNYSDDGLTINSTHVTTYEDSYLTMEYPMVDGEIYDAENLPQSLLIVPGLYFADLYYNVEGNGGSNSFQPMAKNARRAAEDDDDTVEIPQDYVKVSDYHLDLSALQPNSTLSLGLFATKNGAYIPEADLVKIIIAPSSSLSVPTGIDAVESSADAEFYTLQGLKVANPQPGKIYIRIRNGVASKILAN